MTGERIFVALGSNLGDRQAHLEGALEYLARLGGSHLIAVAPVIESRAMLPPEDPSPQPDYLNTVAELSSSLGPVELLRALKGVERSMGRLTTTRWAARTIDLDLVLYGRQVLHTPELVLPHPGLAQRRFVLQPLAHLGADVLVPGWNVTVAALLARLPPDPPGR